MKAEGRKVSPEGGHARANVWNRFFLLSQIANSHIRFEAIGFVTCMVSGAGDSVKLILAGYTMAIFYNAGAREGW